MPIHWLMRFKPYTPDYFPYAKIGSSRRKSENAFLVDCPWTSLFAIIVISEDNPVYCCR